MRKVLEDDNPAPFSSDKIRAKILDLGEGASIKYVKCGQGGGGGPKIRKFCGCT